MTDATTTTDPSRTLEVLDPRTGELVGSLTSGGPDEVADAVQRARAAFGSWSRVDPAERGAALHAVADALEAHAEELAELTTREMGKPHDDALGGVQAGIGTLRQYAELGPLHRGHRLQGGFHAIDYAIAQPRGVVAALTPWNDPVAIACGLIGAAVVTGNTVVHKPSERCPHLGERFGELAAAALPTDVLVTLTGDGDTGRLLASSLDVDVLAHVGSTVTGLEIEQCALRTGAHVLRENGGNDALVVDADVDPAWAAEQAATGAFANAGQICTSVERIFVHRDVADAFVEHLADAARRLADSGDMGPLVDERMRETVHGQVREALERGATAVAGGELPDSAGTYYPPTVLTGVDPSMTVMREETFGPVAPVCVVDSFDEGLRLAADDRYGLAATVLTRSMAHAQRAAAELPVGTVKINAVFGGAPGGAAEPRKGSGHGFGYGPELLDEMTAVKVVHVADAP